MSFQAAETVFELPVTTRLFTDVRYDAERKWGFVLFPNGAVYLYHDADILPQITACMADDPTFDYGKWVQKNVTHGGEMPYGEVTQLLLKEGLL